MHLSWPAGWQTRAPEQRGAALFLEARQQAGGKTVQHLQITAINVSAASKPVTQGSVQELAEKLRAATARTAVEQNIPLHKFERASGYFFSATDRAPKTRDFKQLIEAVIVQSGYLLNVTLLTNDATSNDATAILHAIDNLRVQ